MKRFILDVLRPVRDVLFKRSYRQLYFRLNKLLYMKRYVPLRNVKFLDFSFDLPDGKSAYFSFKELFCDEIYNFSTQQSIPVIIDCGSNIGASVAFFKMKYPLSQIVAIEADSNIFAYLNRNMVRNKFLDVTLINKAVWFNNDGVCFKSEGADGGQISSEASEVIPSLSLRELLKSFKIVDFLKIDIEGAETLVLKSCDGQLEMVHNMFIEYHSRSDQDQELDELLSVIRNNGFRYTIQDLFKQKHPFQHTSDPKSFDVQLNIFCRKEKSIR